MTNAELIEKLHKCKTYDGCNKNCELFNEPNCHDLLIKAAADALEAAEKRIAELSLDCELFQQKCIELGAQMQTVKDCHALEEGERKEKKNEKDSDTI